MRYWDRTQTELTSQGKPLHPSNAGLVSEFLDPGSHGQRYINVILSGFLPHGFRYKLAALDFFGEMSGQDLAQECIIGVAGEA